jgi:hypothetical protein
MLRREGFRVFRLDLSYSDDPVKQQLREAQFRMRYFTPFHFGAMELSGG